MFCANDILALGLIDGLRQKGHRVPEDYAVLGVDDVQMAAWPAYNLTTIQQPTEKIAAVVVEDLLARIHGEETKTGQSLMQPGTMVERASC